MRPADTPLNSFEKLPPLSRLYWLLVVLSGPCCVWTALRGSDLQSTLSLRFAVYALTAVLASGLKVRLPGIRGTLSMNYVVIVACLLDQGLAPTMLVAMLSCVAQCLIHPAAVPEWFQVVFSACGVALPVYAAFSVLHWPLLESIDPTGIIPLMTASAAYFATNTAMVAGIVGSTGRRSWLRTWVDSYFWTSPQYLAGSVVAYIVHHIGRIWGWPAFALAIPPVILVYRSYSLYLGRIEQQQSFIRDMARLHLRTIEALALAIDAKDDTTAAHLRRVQVYASEIGRELRLSEPEMQALEAAALLHDVGKLAVPEYIISKPGKLTAEEFEKMKVHPVVGAEILQRVDFPYPVVPIVRSHHEKWDGTGYPDGLAGEEIPIGARILSAVDCLDALASNRQYRSGMPIEEAMKTVSAEAGKAYDPKIVALLQLRFRELEAKAKAESAAEGVRLSTKVRVERGIAPATGLERTVEKPAGSGAIDRDFTAAISDASREFQMLQHLTSDLGNSLSVEDTLALLSVRLARTIRHDAVAIYLLDRGALVPRFVKGESYRLFNSLRIPVGQGLSGWVAENNQPIVNGNPAVEAGYLDDPRLVTPLRSAVAVPLRVDETTIGVLTLYSLAAEAFTADDRRMLLAAAPRAARAIRNSLSFETATLIADTDDLTGLYNSRYLFAHLEKEIGRHMPLGAEFAVLLMDLDGFKQANDRHGHLVGNRILQKVATELRRVCRAGDVAARLGGDEFVLVIADPEQDLHKWTMRLTEAFSGIGPAVGCDTPVSVSIGISRYPRDGADAEALIENADSKMYEAKNRKRIIRIA
jgi:diguanylate cyclase (GGDEF)-like protein/putative nucleotidyltransferase with HDIG domain